MVLCRNDYGTDLADFSVVKLSDLLNTHTDTDQRARDGRQLGVFKATAPDGTGAVGILQEPIGNGKFGRVMVLGQTLVKVQVNASTDKFAKPVAGVVAYLDSDPGAGITVLYKFANSGQVWAAVLVGGQTSGGGILRGKLDGTQSYQGSAVMSVWAWNGTAEADTGENVTVYDWHLSSGQTIASGKQVTAAFVGGRWYVVAAQCA